MEEPHAFGMAVLDPESTQKTLEVSDQTQLAVAINRSQFKLPLVIRKQVLDNLSLDIGKLGFGEIAHYLEDVEEDFKNFVSNFDADASNNEEDSSILRCRMSPSKCKDLVTAPKIVSDMSFASLTNHVSHKDAHDDVYLVLARPERRLGAKLYCAASWIHLFRGSLQITYCEMSQDVKENLIEFIEKEEELLGFEENFLIHQTRLGAGDTLLMPAGFVVAFRAHEKSFGVEGTFLNSLNLSNQLRSFEEQSSLGSQNCFGHTNFKALHWGFGRKTASSQRLTNVDDNYTSALNTLTEIMSKWLDDDGIASDEDDRSDVLKRLRRLLLEAESSKSGLGNRVSLRRNKAKKRMQSDFIDTDAAVIEDNNQQLATAKAAKLASKLAKANEQVKANEKTKAAIKLTIKTPSANNTAIDRKDHSVRQLSISTTKRPKSKKFPASNLSAKSKSRSKSDDISSMLNEELGSLISTFKGVQNTDNEEDCLVVDESLKKAVKRPFIGEDQSPLNDVHEDDDFVYPTLDFSSSDDETRVLTTRTRDKAWTPKVRIKGVSGRVSKPSQRSSAKASVQKGLKMTSERLSAKKKKRRHATKESKDKTSDDEPKFVPAPSLMSTLDFPQGRSRDNSARSSGSKKGLATAKQRLGKILKLKF